MKTPTDAVVGIAVAGISACKIVDDDEPPAGGTEGGDSPACVDGFLDLVREGCPPGSYPQVHYDGGTSTVVELDDPEVAVSLGVGLLVDFGAGTGADWVGYKVSRSGECTMGCFVAGCALGQYGCYATNAGGELCSYWCGDVEDVEACAELAAVCLDGGTGDGGLDGTGGSEDGETDGSPLEYDCTDWHPEEVESLGNDGCLVPRSLVEVLWRDNGDPFVECDGVRIRRGSEGFWRVSKMKAGGLLDRLGLGVGDEFRMLDTVVLGTVDGWLAAADELIGEDGLPRWFPDSHPGFVLRVQRRDGEVSIRFRVGGDG